MKVCRRISPSVSFADSSLIRGSLGRRKRQCDIIQFDEGGDYMGRIILAVIATILFGCVGILIGMQCNLGGDLGIIFSITTMGAFILEAITNRK